MKYLVNILLPVILYSQNTGIISGTIIDLKSGDGMPGVNVIVKGTYYGASSDLQGKYPVSYTHLRAHET